MTAAAEPERASPTAISSESSEQCAPATLGWPGVSASAAASWISGRPTSNAESASCGSSMIASGPSHTASTERGSPMATNGGSSKRPLLSQHLAMTSAPIPAGSPIETASGPGGKRVIARALPEFDHRITPKIAQVTPGAQIDPLLVQLAEHLVIGRSGRIDLVAAADDEDADALVDRAERLGRLADLQRQHDSLEGGRQVADLDLVAFDQLGVEIGRDLVGPAAAADVAGGLGEAGDERLGLLPAGPLGKADRHLLQSEHRVARVGGQDLAGVLDGDDREAALDRDRLADLPRAHRAQMRRDRLWQLLGTNPAEVAADRGR